MDSRKQAMKAATEREEPVAVPKLRSLFEISRVLVSSIELKESYPKILTVLTKNSKVKRAGILMMNPEEPKAWEMGSARGLADEEMKRRKEFFGSGVIRRILEKGQMAAVIDGGEGIWLYEGRTKMLPKRSQVSFFCAPIKIQGSVVGIMGIDHFYEEPVPIAEDFNFLEDLCALISEALMMRKGIAAEHRALLEENWSFRKELESLGQSVPKPRKKISLNELLEERLSKMIAEIKIDPRSNGHLYDDVLIVVERTLLKSALEKTKNVQLKTARFLGINRNTLRRKMKEMGITAKER
jgi:transcriptional regulator with GAF, ATPase, and Fis domain